MLGCIILFGFCGGGLCGDDVAPATRVGSSRACRRLPAVATAHQPFDVCPISTRKATSGDSVEAERTQADATKSDADDADDADEDDSNVTESTDQINEHATPFPFYDDFSPTVLPASSDPIADIDVYSRKPDVPTQRPWIEWGRRFYDSDITPPAQFPFGRRSGVRPRFYLYGDYRVGIASGRNAIARTDNLAGRLNLDADLQITDTSRVHAFVGPIDNGQNFSRWELVAGDLRFRDEIDFTPATLFYEGDLGQMLSALDDRPSMAELPIAVGLVPLLFQNGIWMEDAVVGGAISLPAKHSRLLNWSNFDATFFAVFDQLNSPAFGSDDDVAQAFGTAWFIEAYEGYLETGYAYVRDRKNDARSYHNVTASFTRNYLDRINNSIRVIVNAGQDGPEVDRTADGVLLLVENSWVTRWPLTVVPYFNAFAGWGTPQSVARAGVSGGILRNTGINFDTDGLNGYATLDPTGSDTAGFSAGVDLLGDCLDRQWIVEGTYLAPNGDLNPRVRGHQYAVGTRVQRVLTHRTLVRFDSMYGWRGGLTDVYGMRVEWRWKF